MINYCKMSGTGNTFIVIDGDQLEADLDIVPLVADICDNHNEHGGADGLIILRRPAQIANAVETNGRPIDFEMQYYNRDGSSGMMCGNGGRCALRFAMDHGMIADPNVASFTNAGVVYHGVVSDSTVSISFPDPLTIRHGVKLQFGTIQQICHVVDVGTPHAVILFDELTMDNPRNLAGLDIERHGPRVRHNRVFGTAGANANFVQVDRAGGGIHLRTFERGVETETAACGTGAIASAIVAAQMRKLKPPIDVVTTSGRSLRVNFDMDDNDIYDITLEGDAETLIEGVADWGNNHVPGETLLKN